MAVMARFYTSLVRDDAATAEIGTEQYKEIEMVELTIDEKTVVPKRVDEKVIAQFPKQYEAFKAGLTETPVTGMPLSEWAKIDRGSVETLRRIGIRSVEELAEARENDVRKVARGFQLQRDARAWLETADHGRAVERENALKAEIDKMREQNEEMRRMLEELTKPEEDQAPRRGRPKKDAA